jgi:hypothetical protein
MKTRFRCCEGGNHNRIVRTLTGNVPAEVNGALDPFWGFICTAPGKGDILACIGPEPLYTPSVLKPEKHYCKLFGHSCF